jgi:hypothetical protein
MSRNFSATSFEPTASPRKIVVMLISAFCAAALSRSTTPHSRIRLPKHSIPSSGAASGSSRATRISSISGNTIRSRRLTSRSCTISMARSRSWSGRA